MTLETTLVALEATNKQLTAEVVQVKTTSTQAQNAAVAARNRAEAAASTTESTRELMLAKFRDFSEIEAAVADSDANAKTTTANRTYIEQQVIHVDEQRAHLDTQRAHLDNQRAHEDGQRAHIDSQRADVDVLTAQVRADATQVAEDRGVVAEDRERAESARLSAEALYVDLDAINAAKLATKASEDAAAGSAFGAANARTAVDEKAAHVDQQKANVDSQVVHVGEQVAHVDSQVEHVNAQRAHVDQRASEINTSADIIVANIDTINEHKDTALAAQNASEAARDESREWATGDSVVGVINGENRYSARKEADRSLAERQAAEAAATASLNSADNSAASANAASTSESNTNAARIEAMKWASQDEDIEIAPGLYSAKHYMLKTRTIATGTLVYVGSWDASTGVYPTAIAPATGHFYKVSVAGTINGEEFLTGDQIIFNGTDWDHVDNTERVTSVGGFIGDVSDSQLLASIKRVHGVGSGLNADLLDGKHASDFHLKSDFAFEATGSAPMIRDASGDTWCRLFRSTYASTNADIAGIYTTKTIGGDYMRPSTPDQLKTALGIVWADIGSKPGSFTPAAHTHDQHEVRVLGHRLTVESDGKIVVNNTGYRQAGMYGTYDSSRTGHIWSMGSGYAIPADGSDFGNLYGLAYKHTNNVTGGTMGGGHQMVWCANGVPRCSLGDSIWTSGNITAYSDARVKTNIKPIRNALDKVCKIGGYTFNRTDISYDEQGSPTTPLRQTGVIAQEVLTVLPEAVTGGPSANDPDGHYSVAYGNLVGLLIEAIKEERAAREKLASRLAQLESRAA